MTHFLAAGFVFDHIDDIGRGLAYLERLVEQWRSAAAPGRAASLQPRELDEAGRVIAALASHCREARRTLETLESEPIIYTGGGSTQQVISMLEGLLARGGAAAPAAAPPAAAAGAAAAATARAAAPEPAPVERPKPAKAQVARARRRAPVAMRRAMRRRGR